MAENAMEAPKFLPTKVPEIEELHPQQLSMLLVSESDADLTEKVTTFCQRNNIRLQVAKDSRQLVDALDSEMSDIILVTDKLSGLESSVASHLLKGFLDLRSTTMVLITKDKAKLEGAVEDFDHRVFAPIDKNVLESIVQIHRSASKAAMGRGRQGLSHDEKRLDSIVRSKVARILKSHNQLEEYYSTRVRELEEKVVHLEEQLENRDKGED